MNLKKFFSELKRREVYKVAIAYGITSWLIAQISGLISNSFEFPQWVMQMIITILIIGFPIALILSWVFELTSKGIRKTTPLASDSSDENKMMETRLVIGVLVLISLLMIGGWWTWQEFGFDKDPPIRNLVVLPFDNYTGNDDYEYFVAGIHSSLIQDIGKIGELTVKSKITANSFKETDMSLPEIAAELGIDAAVEGSITCMGEDSVCVQIRLTRAYPEEQQVWVQDYRVEKSQILNFYNKVAKQISNEINITLTPREESLLAESRTVNKEAYDDYLIGNFAEDFSKESLDKALGHLNSAIEKEPDWAPLYVGLTSVWLSIQQMGNVPTSVSSPKIYENLNKALELDPDLSDAHNLSGLIAHVMEWDWEKSEREYLKALAINPNDAGSRVLYAQLLCVLQRPDEALAQGRLALNLDPLNPVMKSWYGAVVLMAAGDCKTALALAEEITAADPGHYLANNGILLSAFHCKEYDKLIKAERYLLHIYNVKEEEMKEIERIFNEQGIVKAYEKIMKYLEDFSSNNRIRPLSMAYRYIIANQPDKAMDWLEKGFEVHDPTMTYIATKMNNYDPLFNNPRFIDIVEKMNLPMSDKQNTPTNNHN